MQPDPTTLTNPSSLPAVEVAHELQQPLEDLASAEVGAIACPYRQSGADRIP